MHTHKNTVLEFFLFRRTVSLLTRGLLDHESGLLLWYLVWPGLPPQFRIRICIEIPIRWWHVIFVEFILISNRCDAITTIGLIEAVVIQAGYLPSPLRSCSGLDKLGPYPSGEPHWLDILARGESRQPTTRLAMCQEKVFMWRVNIAMGLDHRNLPYNSRVA